MVVIIKCQQTRSKFITGGFALLHHGGLLGLQDVVGEDPGHGHLDGELDSAAHGQLQEELSEPQLGQVTALLQGLWTAGRTRAGGRKGIRQMSTDILVVQFIFRWISFAK